jgi:hypothetical protein
MYFSTRSTPPVAGEISLLFSVLFFCFPDAQVVTSLVQECSYKKMICFQKKRDNSSAVVFVKNRTGGLIQSSIYRAFR